MKTIKNFSNYKANTATGEVINAKTGKAQTIKKGTGKFYLTNDKGEKKLIALDKMEFVEEKKAAAPKKEKAVKLPTIETVEKLLENQKISKIVSDETMPKHLKVHKLNKLSIPNKSIGLLIEMSTGNVLRYVKDYAAGRRTA